MPGLPGACVTLLCSLLLLNALTHLLYVLEKTTWIAINSRKTHFIYSIKLQCSGLGSQVLKPSIQKKSHHKGSVSSPQGDSVTNFLEQDTDPTGKGLGVAIQLSIRTASAPVSYRGGKPITFRQNEGNVITCRPTSTGPKWTR